VVVAEAVGDVAEAEAEAEAEPGVEVEVEVEVGGVRALTTL
jgi:hypothetical protein